MCDPFRPQQTHSVSCASTPNRISPGRWRFGCRRTPVCHHSRCHASHSAGVSIACEKCRVQSCLFATHRMSFWQYFALTLTFSHKNGQEGPEPEVLAVDPKKLLGQAHSRNVQQSLGVSANVSAGIVPASLGANATRTTTEDSVTHGRIQGTLLGNTCFFV